MQQIQLITKQDLDELKTDILHAVAALANNQHQQQKKWVRSKEARTILSISASSLQTLRIRGQLRPNKVGGIYYYSIDELNALLNAGTK